MVSNRVDLAWMRTRLSERTCRQIGSRQRRCPRFRLVQLKQFELEQLEFELRQLEFELLLLEQWRKF